MNTDKSDNELIAEFMGAERREGPRAFNSDQTLVQWIIKGNPYNQHRDDVKHWYQPVELKYHESWDWLMPVVEKIAEYRLAYPKESGWVCDCKIVIKQKYLYREVVQFIKFLNQSNQNEPKD